MKNVTIQYGHDNGIAISVGDGETVAQIIGSPRVKAFLGYGDNVTVATNGATVCESSVPLNGATLSVVDGAARKG